MTIEQFEMLDEKDYGRAAIGYRPDGSYLDGWVYSLHEAGSATLKSANGEVETFPLSNWYLHHLSAFVA